MKRVKKDDTVTINGTRYRFPQSGTELYNQCVDLWEAEIEPPNATEKFIRLYKEGAVYELFSPKEIRDALG